MNANCIIIKINYTTYRSFIIIVKIYLDILLEILLFYRNEIILVIKKRFNTHISYKSFKKDICISLYIIATYRASFKYG